MVSGGIGPAAIGGRLAIAQSPCQSAPGMNRATSPIVIAVDGPAASGKGTIARALARHLGLPHMDTGMLYRSVALSMFRFGGDPASEFEALRACEGVAQVDPGDPELRSEIVGSIASRISAYPGVRAALLDRQRHFAAQPLGSGA
jgi:CMP/dCMP kinase